MIRIGEVGMLIFKQFIAVCNKEVINVINILCFMLAGRPGIIINNLET